MTFEEIAALRQEDFVDVDGSPCPLPSPESIAAAREIHDAVLALGPVPAGAEIELDADLNGGCAVNLYAASGDPRHVWFHTRQDGGRGAIVCPPVAALDAPSGLAEQAAAARRFVGWP